MNTLDTLNDKTEGLQQIESILVPSSSKAIILTNIT